MSPGDMPKAVKAQFVALLSLLKAMVGESKTRWAEPAAKSVPGSGGPIHRAAQISTIISVVVVGVVALIGILIFAQINDALPQIENAELDNASAGVTEGFANALELVPIVLLVMVAALVIGVVQRMRMQA